MGFWLVRKKVAFHGPPWGSEGHYMGLNLGVFFEMGAYLGADFRGRESDGFMGVFLGRGTLKTPEWAWGLPDVRSHRRPAQHHL